MSERRCMRCMRCDGEGHLPDPNPIYAGWRCCDCPAGKALAARIVGKEPQEGAPNSQSVVSALPSADTSGVPSCDSCGRPAIVGGLCCHDYPDCEPPRDSPELAAIRAATNSIEPETEEELGRVYQHRRALLRMVDELTTKLAITNLCIVWDAEYPREAELLTECRRQEERAERAEEALSDKAHLLKAFALLKDRVKVLEADLETANHWRHKANEALDGQANRANKIEKERDDLRAKLAEAEKTNSMLVGDNCELLKRAEAAEALAAKNDARAKLLLADREAAEARVTELEKLIKNTHGDNCVCVHCYGPHK